MPEEKFDPIEAAKHFHYNIFWSFSDEEWVGKCERFEFMSYLDRDPAVAIAGIMMLVVGVLEDDPSLAKWDFKH